MSRSATEQWIPQRSQEKVTDFKHTSLSEMIKVQWRHKPQVKNLSLPLLSPFLFLQTLKQNQKMLFSTGASTIFGSLGQIPSPAGWFQGCDGISWGRAGFRKPGSPHPQPIHTKRLYWEENARSGCSGRGDFTQLAAAAKPGTCF